MISIGVQSPGVQVEAAREISLYKAFLAVTNIVFAYSTSTLLSLSSYSPSH